MPRRARKTARPAARRADDPDRRIIDAALALAARKGWARVALGEVAREAGMSLAELYGRFRSKTAIVCALIARIDEHALGDPPASGDPVRDKLFDLIMRRFDALAPHKDGVRAVVADLAADPIAALCLGRRLTESMRATAEAAGVPTGGLLGLVRVKALTALYAVVLRTWLGDQSSDKSTTMAALDRGLKRLEMIENSLPRGAPSSSSAAA